MKKLEEENQRLYAHLERMQEEKEQLQYKKLLDVFDGIAGIKSQYLLSEIFEEVMNGNGVEPAKLIGKLKNLFHYLRIMGIEPSTYGFEISEEVEISREVLKEKFTLTSPLSKSEENVKIKILKNGWIVDGKNLIYPLAEEVTE